MVSKSSGSKSSNKRAGKSSSSSSSSSSGRSMKDTGRYMPSHGKKSGSGSSSSSGVGKKAIYKLPISHKKKPAAAGAAAAAAIQKQQQKKKAELAAAAAAGGGGGGGGGGGAVGRLNAGETRRVSPRLVAASTEKGKKGKGDNKKRSSNRKPLTATSVDRMGKRKRAAPSLMDSLKNVLSSIVGRFTSSFA